MRRPKCLERTYCGSPEAQLSVYYLSDVLKTQSFPTHHPFRKWLCEDFARGIGLKIGFSDRHIDITDRVREFIAGTTIDVAESERPRGRHTVEIEVADVRKNLSRRIFTFTVK